MSSAIWIFYLLLWSHFAFACKFLRSVSILEANYLQKFNNPNYIHTLAGATQEISVNLTKLFQEELSEASNPAIYFTDAAESRPFVIRQAKDGSRFLVNEAPLDREDICNPFKFPDRVSVARKCCAKSAGEGIAAMHESSQRDLKCCMFLGITVEGYGTFALKIDVIDVNDNRPQFNVPADSLLIRPGKEDLFVIKITENTPQGTVIGLPRVVDLDEGKSADMLFQIEKVNSQMEWEQHFKLLSHVEDRCIPKLYEGLPSHRETDLPALCLLRTIDRETVAGFAFNLIARDQGEPVALSNTLSMTILVIDENDNAPTFTQNEFNVSVKENEIGKTLVHLQVNDLDAGENARLSYFLRPGSHFVADKNPSSDFLRMHILASPAPDGVILRLIQPLDYETVKSFDFQVVVQDHGIPRLASTATVSVEVLNTNDKAPVIRFFNKGNLLNSDYASLELLEDTDNNFPKVICHVHVYDEDSNLEDLFCDINSPQRHFDLREVSTENTVQKRKVYELISLTQLDREKSPSYSVGVSCVDGRTATRLSGQSQIRILLKDANDNGPVFEKSQYFGSVVENEANALVDFKDSSSPYRMSAGPLGGPSHIRATDVDIGPNAAVRYSLAARNEEGTDNSTQKKSDHEFFYIDRVTGHLKTWVALDFENKSAYRFIVIATDQPMDASRALSSTAKVTVTVRDLDDNPPTMLQREYAFEVAEGLQSHSVVGRVEANDGDSLPENRAIHYLLRPTSLPEADVVASSTLPSSYSSSFSTSSKSAANAALHFFTVDRNSGVIRTLRPLDREQTPKMAFEVVAHSANLGASARFQAGTSLSSTARVVVTVLDKNDNSPYMTSLSQTEKTKVLLAEIVVPPGGFKGDPKCVPFPYGFHDDDELQNGNSNVTVALETNQHFVFNGDQTEICLKSDNPKAAMNGKSPSTTTPPPPGRYSLNILAQDNPIDSAERHTKKFPLRVLIQTSIPEIQNSDGLLRHRDTASVFKPQTVGTGTTGRQHGVPPSMDRVPSGRRRNASQNSRGLMGDAVGGEAGPLGGEYRNVTIIAVLVCMACILCIVLLAILFFKKCPTTKTLLNKVAAQNHAQGNLHSPSPVNLCELSTENGKFGTVDRYPEFNGVQYPCMDMQPQMLVTLRPGEDKGFSSISPTGHVMGSVIYTDDANRMSPLLIQKNNLRMPACQVGSLQKVAVTSIYGSPRTSAHVVTGRSPVCSNTLVTQIHSPTQVDTTATLQSDNQTYGLLVPSKSYDELNHCSSQKSSTLKCQPLHTYRPTTFVLVTKQHHANQDGYQSPLTQTSISDDYTPISVGLPASATGPAAGLCAIPVSISRSPASAGDPRAHGRASFV